MTLAQRFGRVEAPLFRALNTLGGPVAQAGWFSPRILWPTGLILLETTGRVSGSKHRVPVLATLHAGYVIVGTVRAGRSQWYRNLLAEPRVSYWLRGEERQGSAILLAPAPESGLPPELEAMARALAPFAVCPDVGFAAIAPDG